MHEEYRALRDKLEAFCGEASERAGGALQCRRGCDGCCQVWLSVGASEAEALESHLSSLSADRREQLRSRGAREQSRERAGGYPARCAMLDDDGSCAVYPARPSVCRTQGLPLRYPAGEVPAESVRWRSSAGDEVVACPLNYETRAPDSREILDADRLQQLVALVNTRTADRLGVAREARWSLSALASGQTVERPE